MNELKQINQSTAIEIFTSDSMTETLNKIKSEVMSFVPDLSTAKGRKEIASLSAKVSKSKVVLDNAGKTLTADWKSKAKLVDISRKEARDFLDVLRDEVRKPLTDWEDEEKRKVEEEKIRAEIELDHIDALSMNDLFNRELAIQEKEQLIAAEEAEKLRIEEEKKAADEKVVYELKLKEQAAEQARLEAEQEAQNKIDEAKRLESEAIEKAKRLEAEKIEAENRIKWVAEQAEKNRLQAIKDAEFAKEQAVKAEQLRAEQEAGRIEQERLNREAEERKQSVIKASNLQHRKKVNNSVLKLLISSGADDELAKNIIKTILKSKNEFITINY